MTTKSKRAILRTEKHSKNMLKICSARMNPNIMFSVYKSLENISAFLHMIDSELLAMDSVKRQFIDPALRKLIAKLEHNMDSILNRLLRGDNEDVDDYAKVAYKAVCLRQLVEELMAYATIEEVQSIKEEICNRLAQRKETIDKETLEILNQQKEEFKNQILS